MTRLAFFSTDMSRNAVYVPWQFKGALEQKYSITLLGPASGDVWEPLRGLLAPDTLLPGRNPLSPSVFATALAATEHTDILFAFKAFPESLGLALRVSSARGIPVALHLCDWDAGFFADRPLRKQGWYAARNLVSPSGPAALRVMESFIGRVDILTVSSRALQRRFGGTLVRQGVDTDRVDPRRYSRRHARAKLGIRSDETLVLFLGTPRAHKGLGDVARAVKELAERRLRLMVVGVTDPVADGLEELPEGVAELRPPVSVEAAPWYLRAADVFVLPQRPTPFAAHQLPAKLLMAMAMGAAVLATDVGDARELLTGSSPAGVVVPPCDQEALCEGLRQLVRDRDTRTAMGVEARNRAVSQLSWTAMESRLTPLLKPFLRT